MSNQPCLCYKCRKPTQVYGSRWCADCYYPSIDDDWQRYKELLELAAKAAGYAVEWDDHYKQFRISMRDAAGRAFWNPLTDDGDALRLAVKLGLVLNLSPREDCRGQTVVTYHGISKIEEPCYEGREEAARRAIVRAAAAMAA